MDLFQIAYVEEGGADTTNLTVFIKENGYATLYPSSDYTTFYTEDEVDVMSVVFCVAKNNGESEWEARTRFINECANVFCAERSDFGFLKIISYNHNIFTVVFNENQ